MRTRTTSRGKAHLGSARHRIEALNTARREFDGFWGLAPDLMCVVGSRLTIERSNPAWLHLLGWSEGELHGALLCSFVHPDDREGFLASLAGKHTELTRFRYECRMRTKAGSYCSIEWAGQHHGSGLYCVGRDASERQAAEQAISERQQTERELARQRGLLERILDASPTGISYMNAQLVYELVNPAQARAWGVSVEEALGKSVYELFGPETERQLAPLLRGALAGKPHYATAFEFTQTARKAAAPTSYWDFGYIPLCDEHTGEMGVLVVATEVSDRVNGERLQREKLAALEETDQMKDQFLSILSHELRTPISTIVGFGGILEDELLGPLNPGQQDATHQLMAASEHMMRLVNNLLDMTRIQTGKLVLAPRLIEVAELVEDVLAGMAAAVEEKHQTLVCQLPEGVPPAMVDEQRLAQILSNLLANAVKFTPDGGTITVRLSDEGSHLRWEVKDTGVGIASEDQERVFKLFSQLDMSSTREVGGTGLGLAIARALVHAHGGRIGFESEASQGSLFWFTLPKGETAPTAAGG